MRFGGVTEVNFQSILRRSFVWKPKAKFLDAKYLDAHYPNHAADGVFAKKPLLKKFLSSGPASAAGIRLQHGFESLHSPTECRNCIEAYAALGGDDGLTWWMLTSNQFSAAALSGNQKQSFWMQSTWMRIIPTTQRMVCLLRNRCSKSFLAQGQRQQRVFDCSTASNHFTRQLNAAIA